MPDPISVVLIGRLAVDEEFKGQGLGVSLLQDASSKGIEASRTVGARAFIVHARVLYILVQDAEATIADLAGSRPS